MTLTFAIGPVHLDAEGEDLRRRVAMRLVDRLHTSVQVMAASSYDEVAGLLADGGAHFAWMPPAVFVRAEEAGGLRLLAQVERSGGDGYRGVLFVRPDAGISTPGDLEGKRIAWVDPSSCAGHLFVRLALKEAGLAPGELFGEQSFVGSHHSVVQQVVSGKADAGATHAQTLDGETLLFTGWHPFVGPDGMAPLLISAPIPSDVICASTELDPDLLDELREALLSLHEDDDGELLEEFFGGARLVGASSASYDPVRIAMQE